MSWFEVKSEGRIGRALLRIQTHVYILHKQLFIDSLWPNDTIEHRWTWSTLIRVVACHLIGKKLLSESKLFCYEFGLLGTYLTHWGRVTHICVGELTIIVSDNGLLPGRRQAIIWINDGILLIGPYGTNFSEILIKILVFSFTKMSLKVPSAKWRPFCLGLNVLSEIYNKYNHFFILGTTSWSQLGLARKSNKILKTSEFRLYGCMKLESKLVQRKLLK